MSYVRACRADAFRTIAGTLRTAILKEAIRPNIFLVDLTVRQTLHLGSFWADLSAAEQQRLLPTQSGYHHLLERDAQTSSLMIVDYLEPADIRRLSCKYSRDEVIRRPG